jgi:hypothetical protein
MKKVDKDLKLIYVLKIGKNSKGEIVYEFIFSKDIENIDVEMWNWDQSPAIEHKEFTVPDPEYVESVFSLTTKDFVLSCLHDAVDRPYIHGYHLIHALAYEDEESEELGTPEMADYEEMFEGNEDMPLLVFHYGMTLKQVEDKLYERNIIIKGNQFINTSAITKN